MKTLVTGVFPLTPQRRAALEGLGLELTFHQDERVAVESPERFEAVICNGLFTFQDIRLFTSLRYIQLTSAGMDRVPLDYCREHGIRVENARGVYSAPMAEFALWGVLELYKQGRFFAENQKAHRWEKHRGLMELGGKTVCVVGCGSVGSACAKRFSAFDCHVLGVDLTADARAYFDRVLSLDALDEALGQSDVVVLTLPLTEQTRGLFDKHRFNAMKPGAVLVNIARGPIVDTRALLEALDTHLSGAVLDVFETEPLPENSPLWDKPNVILTPHNSFVGNNNPQRLEDLVLINLRAVCAL